MSDNVLISQRNLKVHYFNAGHLTAILRELVLSKMGAAGANSIIAEARKRFQAHCSETEIIPGDLRSPVSPSSCQDPLCH